MNRRPATDFINRFHSQDTESDFTVKNIAKWTAIVVIVVLGGFGLIKIYQVLFGATVQMAEPWSPFKTDEAKFIEKQDAIIAESGMKQRVVHIDNVQNVSAGVLGATSDSAAIFEQLLKESAEERKFQETDSDRWAAAAQKEFENVHVTVPTVTGRYGELLSNRVAGKYFDSSLPPGQAHKLPDNYYGKYEHIDLSNAYQVNGFCTPCRR